ncbi:uncharacterized protein LOC126369442 [Pectinophora gossypiella]|uniref:uncharacterized protein LOC126369442 n=1 Tax=Pectinophora gossypiella TaxID=13191 RepID=UPI00214E1910|nr:uncharacterized protein LOC126369442 [Pectinophora gossypiella]
MNYYSFAIVFILLQLNSFLEAKPSGSTIKMHPRCDKQTYCMDKPDDYPQAEFEAILSNLNIKVVNDKEIGKRIGPSLLCDSQDSINPIYQIVDVDGNVRYVAQIDNVFMQKYTVRKCRNPEVNPLSLSGSLDLSKLTCKDIIVAPSFLVLSDDRQKLEVVSIKQGIPMGCTCIMQE